MMREVRLASTEGHPRGQHTDAVSIRDRPPEIEDRAVPGHWEGDLISGAKHSHIDSRLLPWNDPLRIGTLGAGGRARRVLGVPA